MNKIEQKKLMQFLYQHKDAVFIFNYNFIEDSLLEEGKHIISPHRDGDTIFNFIVENSEVIDFKKFVLFGAYSSKVVVSSLNNITNDGISTPSKEYYETFYKFAKENIKENEDVTLFVFPSGKKMGIVAVNSKKELYGKEYVPKKLRINPEAYKDLVGAVQLDSIKHIFKDSNFASLAYDILVYNTLTQMGYKDADIAGIMDKETGAFEFRTSKEFIMNFLDAKTRLFFVPEVTSQINEDNLYITSVYQFIGKLSADIKRYHELNEEERKSMDLFSLRELERVKYLLEEVEKAINFNKVTVLIKNVVTGEEVKEISAKVYSNDYKSALSEYAKLLIDRDNKNIFNPDILALLDKKTALHYAEKIPDMYAEEFNFLLYEANCLTFSEALENIKKIGISDINEEFLRLRAVDRYLTGRNNTLMDVVNQIGMKTRRTDIGDTSAPENGQLNVTDEAQGSDMVTNIERPEVMFAKPLSDENLYELLDDTLKAMFVNGAIKEYLAKGKYSDIAEKNLKLFHAKGELPLDAFMTFYSYFGMDLEVIEEMFGSENVKNTFSAEQLLSTVNDLIEYSKKGTKTEQDEENHTYIVKDYEYLKKIYQKYNLLNVDNNEDKILEAFDDLIFDDNIFKQLYVDGFISGKTLYDFNNELANKLYTEGELRSEDRRYFILNSGIELSVGDIIRLNQEKVLSHQDVFDFYMKDKINLQDLANYGEDIDFSEILKDDELIALAKKYSMIRKDDAKNTFNKYLDAYMKFKKPGLDIQEKLLKSIGGKNAKNEDLLELYSKGVLNIETINPSDDLLLLMIKQGRLKSGDEELLFKDTDMQGTKYVRLMSILRKLDSDDEKLNLLAGVYKTEDEVSSRRLNILANELSYAFNEEGGTTLGDELLDDDNASIKRKDNENDKPKSKVTVVRSLAKMFDTFKSIKTDYEHIILSGTYVVFLDDSALVEEVFRKSADGKSFVTTHATYKISDEFFKHFLKDTYNYDFRKNLSDFFIDVNREGKPYFKWSLLTAARRRNIPGIDKVVHGKTWADRLKAKAIKKPDIDGQELNDVLDKISNSAQIRGVHTDLDDDSIDKSAMNNFDPDAMVDLDSSTMGDFDPNAMVDFEEI